MENNSFKNFMNLLMTFGLMIGLSFGSYQFCNWYGCSSWSGFMRADLICNACVDTAYHLKNFQVSLYSGIFTLVTYKLTSFVNKANAPTDKYIFEDYILGKNSPRILKKKS